MAQFGLDLVEGRVRNNVEHGVLEPTMSKTKMIQVGVCRGVFEYVCVCVCERERERERERVLCALWDRALRAP
jgi:hypothetical protein